MKTKAHTIYKNQAGERVPGVTTILNLIAKPNLIVWANRLGLQGIDSTKFRDEKGLIGTLAHDFIMADLKGESTDTSDYSKNQIDQAENAYLKWLTWREDKILNPILLETPLISEAFQYGGTLDYFGEVDGKLTLVDYKTGFVGKECYIQTCAYRELLIENGYPPAEKILILGIPRTEDERFTETPYTNFENGWQYFKLLRQCYDLEKLIK